MINKKLANLLYYAMIIIVILTCIYIYIYLSGNSRSCVADPIVYYEAKTQSKCFCSVYNIFIP